MFWQKATNRFSGERSRRQVGSGDEAADWAEGVAVRGCARKHVPGRVEQLSRSASSNAPLVGVVDYFGEVEEGAGQEVTGSRPFVAFLWVAASCGA